MNASALTFDTRARLASLAVGFELKAHRYWEFGWGPTGDQIGRFRDPGGRPASGPRAA